MWTLPKSPRRLLARRNRREALGAWFAGRPPETGWALAVALVFWLAVVLAGGWRDQMVRIRLGQYAHQDIVSRVEFWSTNPQRVAELRFQASEATPSIYAVVPDCFAALERTLVSLPEELAARATAGEPTDGLLDPGIVPALIRVAGQKASLEEYRQHIADFIRLLREERDRGRLVVLPAEQRARDIAAPQRQTVRLVAVETTTVDLFRTFTRTPGAPPVDAMREGLLRLVSPLASRSLPATFAPALAAFVVDHIPITHTYDASATEQARQEAARLAPLGQASQHITDNWVLVERGNVIGSTHWKLLTEEQAAYAAHLAKQRPVARALATAGYAALVLLLTVAMAAYVAAFAPRILRNRLRAIGLAALLLLTLVVAQVAATTAAPLHVWGIAPTLLVAIILALAYDQRFALGMATLHGVLVTLALDQGAGFFVTLWIGVLTVCFLLDEVRQRSKLVLVGGAAAGAMALTAAALGAARAEPLGVLGWAALEASTGALGVAFLVLGLLPFIEKAFRITTSITLLELADNGRPLLRQLQMEAPGTYNHSLQVATLAEAAAEAIGADALLCRVAAYYHDIGKVQKPDYFCENQFGGPNRHDNLAPSVSLLVILGHVKLGVELAREYRLPPVIQHAIEQHHGTTLVEYFYQKARQQAEPGEVVQEAQFRYGGPRPRTRENAILMIADAVESASRAMDDPAASRIESLVRDLILKRLLDGQFDECDLTFAELRQVENAIVRTVLALHHARLPYPTTAAEPADGRDVARSA
jgi:putative nucleotidyltransferase with HDIG domain